MPEDKTTNSVTEGVAQSGDISSDRQGKDTLRLRLKGSWKIGARFPSADVVEKKIASSGGIRRIGFHSDKLTGWDSGLLTFLLKISDYCSKNNIEFDKDGLPEGVGRLIALATAVPERKGARKDAVREPFFNRVGTAAMEMWQATLELLAFIGEASIVLIKFLAGKASYRRTDLGLFIQQCGADALPIITLISLLVGLILAFIGAIQLMMFGAQIYVADLVGIAMVRVMGAVMVGIVMAGRTGAAFAAQLGTMQGNE